MTFRRLIPAFVKITQLSLFFYQRSYSIIRVRTQLILLHVNIYIYIYYKIMSYIVGLGIDKQFFRRKYSLTCQCHFLVYYLNGTFMAIYILEELEVALSYLEQKENP